MIPYVDIQDVLAHEKGEIALDNDVPVRSRDVQTLFDRAYSDVCLGFGIGEADSFTRCPPCRKKIAKIVTALFWTRYFCEAVTVSFTRTTEVQVFHTKAELWGSRFRHTTRMTALKHDDGSDRTFDSGRIVGSYKERPRCSQTHGQDGGSEDQ